MVRSYLPILVFLTLGAFAMCAASLFAATITVGEQGDFATIQAAIDAASNGDEVRVEPEIYYENINFNGQNISVIGDQEHPENVVIDGEGNGAVIRIENGESRQCLFAGFAVRNGIGATYSAGGWDRPALAGGGLYICDSSPTIRNSLFESNSALLGGGIFCGSSNAIIEKTKFINNTSGYGALVVVYDSDVEVIDCEFISNREGVDANGVDGRGGAGIMIYRNAHASLIRVSLINNAGSVTSGALHVDQNSSLDGQFITLFGNSGGWEHSGSVLGMFNGGCRVQISNSIAWGNQGRIIGGHGEWPTITFTDIQGGFDGEGNINADPLFVDPDNGDFHLTANSPCIDAGDPNSPNDFDGTRADMGAYYFSGHRLRIVGNCDTPGEAIGIAVAEGFAFVGDGESGLRSVDVSNPESPHEVDSFDTPNYAVAVAINQGIAYVADEGGGLSVINITDPANLCEVSSFATYYALGVAVRGDYAYVADYQAGLRIVDVSDPSDPENAGECGAGTSIELSIQGNHAFVAGYNAGLRIIDISSPTAPREVGYCGSQGLARDVSVSGDYAYVAADLGGLRVIDISAPCSPHEVGSFDTPDHAVAIALSGNYAFIADEATGMIVIDITNPENPVEACRIGTPGHARGIAICSDYAYIADWESGLTIIDISDFIGGQQNDQPRIRVSPLTLAYGEVDVNSSATLPFSITNEGNADLVVTGISSDNEQFTTDYTEAITIAPNESQEFQVTFTPATFDSVTGSLTITSNAADNPSVALTGVGLAPDIAVTPQDLHFGDVEFRRVSEPLTLTVTNEGNADLNVTDMTVSDDQFTFSFDGAFTLIPGASREFPITFTPNVEGEVSASLEITSNDPDECPLSVSLIGVGIWVPSSSLLDRLCARVTALRTAGALNQGQANSLCVKTRNGINRLERNQPSVAIQMLEAFKQEVTAYMRSRVLSAAQGQPLIDEANFIISLISEFGTAGFDGHLVLDEEPLPSETYLSEMYPNPFNSVINLTFGLPENAPVSVRVFDFSGRQVATLASGQMRAGVHNVLWNAEGFTSGIYLVKMEAPGFTDVRKVTLIK